MSETAKPSRAREPENLQAHIDKALALRGQAGARRIYKAARFLFDPQLLHIDRVDTERPSLFVANHGTYGWEGGLLPSVIREHTGMLPRLLADAFMMTGRLEEPLMSLGLVLANRKDGAEIWTFATQGKVDSSPVVCGDKVVVGSEDGRLYLVSLEDGSEVWSYEIGQPVTASPAVARNRIIIGSEDGNVYCFGVQ